LNQPGVMLNAGKTACFQGYFYHLRQSINNLNPIFPDLYLRKIKGLNVINYADIKQEIVFRKI
ncbi:MAG: hypothetical protein SOR75_06770, partial [Synergistes jonesii]|uniref:hypothetical protein n=1 Tax=Synergistes jonesii TaxID=2754 RepID=UPI002A764403